MEWTQFHFLRPLWLLMFLPAAGLWWMMLRGADDRREWLRWMDRPLLDALLLEGASARGIRPVHVVGAFWLIAILALAGPAWRRTPAPFAEDEAALVMVLEVTSSMAEEDVPPSRQKRAAQKVSDLLDARAGAAHAVIAYSGTAHLVMPLTKDAAVIRNFVTDLGPEIMPREGDDPVAALELAMRQFQASNASGAVLMITDELGADVQEWLETHRRTGGVPVHVWAALPEATDGLKQAAAAGGGELMTFSVDESDADRWARVVQETATAAGGEAERWADDGYWLTPVLVLLGLALFRRGG
jgi:Ca-activated chloride channel family protein